MFCISRERPPTFAVRRTMAAGAPRDREQDPGAGRDPAGRTRDPGPRPPTLLSGEGTGAGTETGAGVETAARTEVETGAWTVARTEVETGAWTVVRTEAETGAWTGARTRARAGVVPDPTLEVAESPDQRRGKTPGRDLALAGPGPAHRGRGGWFVPLLQSLGGLYHLGIFCVIIFIISQHFSCKTTHSTPSTYFYIIICV